MRPGHLLSVCPTERGLSSYLTMDHFHLAVCTLLEGTPIMCEKMKIFKKRKCSIMETASYLVQPISMITWWWIYSNIWYHIILLSSLLYEMLPYCVIISEYNIVHQWCCIWGHWFMVTEPRPSPSMSHWIYTVHLWSTSWKYEEFKRFNCQFLRR